MVCVVAVVSVVVKTADIAVVFVVAAGRFTYKITILGLSHAGLLSEIIILNSEIFAKIIFENNFS